MQATARRNSGARSTSSPTARPSTSPTTSRPRDRTQITLATGAITKTVGGEAFPNKNFPDTETTQAAFYVQDIAQWGALG